jgi:hypothetical protein
VTWRKPKKKHIDGPPKTKHIAGPEGTKDSDIEECRDKEEEQAETTVILEMGWQDGNAKEQEQ